MSAITVPTQPRLLPSVACGLLTLIVLAAGVFGAPLETWRQVTAETHGHVRAFGRYPPLGIPGESLYAALLPAPSPPRAPR